MKIVSYCLVSSLLLGQAFSFLEEMPKIKRALDKVRAAAARHKRGLGLTRKSGVTKTHNRRDDSDDEGRVSFKECNLSVGERENCGYFGITEEECYSRECCWGQTQESEVPWCYHSIPTMHEQCTALDDPERVECGDYGIRKETCMAMGCCWRPSNEPEAPWCFHKKRMPVYEGECGVPAISPNVLTRIVGGIDADENSWPWMVSLRADGRHFCGGSLVSERWVVSAAHCAPAFDWAWEKSVVVGSHRYGEKDPFEVELAIEEIITHPDYNDYAYTNDIMVIKLSEPAEFNDAVSPVCLPEATDYTPGVHCYTTGWGTTRFMGGPPEVLQQVMVPTIDRDVCNSPEWYGGKIDSSMVCAGYEEGGRDSCQGDSGGPLVCFNHESEAWELTGVVSWGEGCAYEQKPGIYSNVAELRRWVEDTVSENS